MKSLNLIFAIVFGFGTVHLSHAQSSSAQYISSIKTADTQRASYRTAILSAATHTPEAMLANPKTTEDADDAATALRTSIRSANYVEFSSVGFHPNATIMAATSESLMHSLSNYMQSNPNLRLRIHGHCNNNATRTAIVLGDSQEFFTLTTSNHLKTVTAQELSVLRAECARQYLISLGICPDRIEVIGEAGNRMIYPQTSEYADYNDRIEFRFLAP